MEIAGPADKAVQPETDFAEFYCEVISKLYDLKCRQISSDVKSALRDMRKMKHEGNQTKQEFFSYKIPPVRCAYMYAYCALHSVMIYSEFSKYLELNKRYLMFHPDSLKICCIGGGPGTEAVAICKAMKDFVCKSGAQDDDLLLEVKVTVIDKLPHWKREETAVINAVNDKSNILLSKVLTLQSDFMKADILKPFEKDLREKIFEADIVTIIKMGSYFQDKNSDDCHEDLQNMVTNVIHNMDDNSCLFMLDTAGGNVFYKMRNVLRDYIGTGTSLLRRSDHKEYSLDQKTVNKLSNLMNHSNSKFPPVPPTGRGKVSSCLWIKNALPSSENTKGSCKVVGLTETRSKNSCLSDMRCKGKSTLREGGSDSQTKNGVQPHFVVSENKNPEGKKLRSKKIKKQIEKAKPVASEAECQD